jgi:hypothetical protein
MFKLCAAAPRGLVADVIALLLFGLAAGGCLVAIWHTIAAYLAR